MFTVCEQVRVRIKFDNGSRRKNTYCKHKHSRPSEPRVRERHEVAGEGARRGGMEQHSNIMTGSEHFNTLIEKVYSNSF